MNDNSKNIPVEKFAKTNSIPSSEVIEKIRNGEYMGYVKNNKWYIELREPVNKREELQLPVHQGENQSSYAAFYRKITDTNFYNEKASSTIDDDINEKNIFTSILLIVSGFVIIVLGCFLGAVIGIPGVTHFISAMGVALGGFLASIGVKQLTS